MRGLILLMFLVTFGASANPPTIHVYPMEIDRIVDADTMDVRMEIFPDIYKHTRIRVADFDAPETWRPSTEAEAAHGYAATFYAGRLLTPPLFVKVYGWGVYNRVSADIILPTGENYGTLMHNGGFSKRAPYPPDKE